MIFASLLTIIAAVTYGTQANQDFCHVMYEHRCFWIEVRYRGISFDEGREICAFKGGRPADIYSEDHYYMLHGYMRMFTGKDGDFYAWIGLEYNPNTNTARSAHYGPPVPFVKWTEGYPNPSFCCHMTMVAKADWNSTDQHMHNWRNDGGVDLRRGVICERY